MNPVDERLQAVRKLLLVHIPVAQAGMVVLALAKPAVVHHKSVNCPALRPSPPAHLSGLVDIEFGCLPRVVDHGLGLGSGWLAVAASSRQNVLQLEAMQQPRCLAQPVRRIAAVEDRVSSRSPECST